MTVTETAQHTPLTGEQRAEIRQQLGRITDAFGDDWQTEYDFGEASVRTSDSMPGFFTEIFTTSQFMGNDDEDGPSPVAEWLASAPVLVQRLLAEVERLEHRAETAEKAFHQLKTVLTQVRDLATGDPYDAIPTVDILAALDPAPDATA